MKTLDRYIIRQFLVNYLVLFTVLMLLIITLDLMVNLDEFAQIAEGMPDAGSLKKLGAVIWAVLDFYGPQVFVFYLYAAGVLPVAAAGFTLAGLLRNRELVAMLAGGISLYRVAMPILVLGCLLSTLMLIDQELFIPPLREKLARTHSSMRYGKVLPFTIELVPDIVEDDQGNRTRDQLFTAVEFDPAEKTMTDLWVLRRNDKGQAVQRITADSAKWDAAAGGWRLEGGVLHSLPGGQIDGADGPADARPIAFVESTLDPLTLRLRRNSRYRQLLSIRELTALMNNGSDIVPRDELQRLRHGRFSLMAINVLILAMGLPFFLLRGPGNMLVQSLKAAPLCLGVWAGSFVMMQMGAGGMPPALAAWLPALIYLPVALFMMDRVET